jgi:WhiB family redox-sensing transcriptional regulator
MDWRRLAACRGTDRPDLFFPMRPAGVRKAKAVCARCPVKDQCLQWAMDSRQNFGVWGGKSEKERLRLRRLKISVNSTPR